MGANVCEHTLWSLNFVLFMHVPWARCCVYALVWMCAGAIEAVLWRGSLQENCHNQSAPASVKRQAWENWLLYMLHATPRSLNKPAHLPNAMPSKWAMCFLCATPGWQRSRDTGQCRWAAAEDRCHATPWKWAEQGSGQEWRLFQVKGF